MIEIGSSMIGTATKGKVRLGCRYSMIEIGTYMIGVLLQSPRVYSEWTRYVVPVIPVF